MHSSLFAMKVMVVHRIVNRQIVQKKLDLAEDVITTLTSFPSFAVFKIVSSTHRIR